MAVTEFFLTGSVAANVTIQPAVGTVYSFKRGLILNHNQFQIGLGAATGFYWQATNFAATPAAQQLFKQFTFNEAGYSIWNDAAAVPVTVRQSPSPFAAISRAIDTIVERYSGGTTYYTLLGVSMT